MSVIPKRPESSRAALQRRVTGLPRRVWSALGPGLVTGAADDDPRRHRDLFHCRGAAGNRTPVDRAHNLAAHGRGAGHVRPDRDGDRPGPHGSAAPEVPPPGPGGGRSGTPRRQHHQHRGRPLRHGRCRRAAPRRQLACLGGALRHRYRLGHHPASLRDHRALAQVARPGTLQLRDHWNPHPPALGRSAPGDVCPRGTREPRCLGDRGGDPGDDDQPLSLPFWQASQEVEEEKAEGATPWSNGAAPHPPRFSTARST
jgi:hypothetical protein